MDIIPGKTEIKDEEVRQQMLIGKMSGETHINTRVDEQQNIEFRSSEHLKAQSKFEVLPYNDLDLPTFNSVIPNKPK